MRLEFLQNIKEYIRVQNTFFVFFLNELLLIGFIFLGCKQASLLLLGMYYNSYNKSQFFPSVVSVFNHFQTVRLPSRTPCVKLSYIN